MFGKVFRYTVLRSILTALVLYASIRYLDGVVLEGVGGAFVTSFLILLVIIIAVDIAVYPVFRVLLSPLNLLLFGFLSLILYTAIVFIISYLFPPFSLTSLLHATALGGMLLVVRKIVR